MENIYENIIVKREYILIMDYNITNIYLPISLTICGPSSRIKTEDWASGYHERLHI
jgi:hypothetical protein